MSIYIVEHGTPKDGVMCKNDGEVCPTTTYVYDNGTRELVEKDTDEFNGVAEVLTDPDERFILMLIPFDKVTFDADDKITNVVLPGE